VRVRRHQAGFLGASRRELGLLRLQRHDVLHDTPHEGWVVYPDDLQRRDPAPEGAELLGPPERR
jgi:hypothetical protein